MRSCAAILGVASFLVVGAASAHAQAYLDEPNSFSATFVYTYAPSGKVIAESGGLEVPAQTVFVHMFIPSLQYVTPVKGLAVEGELPMMTVRVGDDAFDHFPMNGPYDDGKTHFDTVDFKGGLRYQLKFLEQYLGASLSAGVSIPTGYPTLGLTAPGHGLKGVYGGVSLARTLDPLISNMFFQLDYTYMHRERFKEDEATEALNRDYSDGSFFLGYFLPANFNVRVGTSARFTHGGADFKTIIFDPPSVQIYHDRLLNEDFIHVGGDVGYTVTPKLGVGLAVRFFVWGQNTRNQNLFGAYASYKLF